MDNFAPDPKLLKAYTKEQKRRDTAAKKPRSNRDELMAKAKGYRNRILNDYCFEVEALTKRIHALRVQAKAADGTLAYGPIKREWEQCTKERSFAINRMKIHMANLDSFKKQ